MTSHNLDLFYDTVLSLTKTAGNLIKEKTSDRNKHIEFKASETDLVTKTDSEVENLLITSLSKKFPGHKFIAEESSVKGVTLTDTPTWIIDPIDGTMNFVHSFPHSCISVALYIDKEPKIGIVYNPILEQLFTARKGQGAFLNGKPIKVSDTKLLSKALIMFENCGGFPKKLDLECFEMNFWLIKESHSTRSLGSAALNLCMVACGAADAYFQYGLSIWDIAAGELIITEAGGLVTNTTGGPIDRFERKILAASSKELIDVLSNRIAEFEPGFLKKL